MSIRASGALGASITAYVGSIATANWATAAIGLVPIGFGLSVTAGTFAAGGALILRDSVQIHGGRRWVAAAIAAGVALSYLAANPRLALASAIAFAGSELLDWRVFSRMQRRSLPAAVLASSAISAPVDTVLFLALAGFGVTWAAVAGQFAVKTLMAAAVSAWLARR